MDLKNFILPAFFLLTRFLAEAFAMADPGRSPEITAGKNSTHIGRITGDTLVVATGSTWSFTVDTPEGGGLVSTKTTVQDLLDQLASKDGSVQKYEIFDKEGDVKTSGEIAIGDRLRVTSQDTLSKKIYYIAMRPMALSGKLWLQAETFTLNDPRSLTLFFTAGQRSPDATVRVFLPAGIGATLDNTTVNVIGRGDVKLSELSKQSIGRVASKYSYSRVGNVVISKLKEGGSVITFTNLDLRPYNGPDLKIVIGSVRPDKVGKYLFSATYTTSKPEFLTSPGTDPETASLTVVRTISDFQRVIDRSLLFRESTDSYSSAAFTWTGGNTSDLLLMQSLDEGKTWTVSTGSLNIKNSSASISGLIPNKLYTFKLSVAGGENKGPSNEVYFYSGKMDIKNFNVTGDDDNDDTEKINEAITYLNKLGGGTLLFSQGIYNIRTVHLKSNVWLYVDSGAVIKALKGGDAPERTWFSDKKYRSGLSPTDPGPYDDPENYLTKQDVGHHYFRNGMFFGERLDNVKIIGNGLITGNGNLVTGDRVMTNAPDNRSDKMFVFKLCTNIEIGGILRTEDLWYDPGTDEPYYIRKDGSKDFNVANMLNIDRSGHFALLATGTDNIAVHDTYLAKNNPNGIRDVYDFMGCNNVIATNIYSRVSSDDIIKPGSDCSLGFTRPARNYKVRNIIGDTNCNLFQIGSETADDITDVHVDNIYVLGANKAGFSISTNDGAHIKDIHLNCGHTGTLHSRSKMYRTFSPFFISISNRGRILGAEVGKYAFTDNEETHNELLVRNVNIGQVENIIINGIDIYEVYGGSSNRNKSERWKAYDGSQRRATPIIAGYSLPENKFVEGGLDFTLPNGKNTGYIKNVEFNDVHVLVKGGNPFSDSEQRPPELGVGQYNVSNLGVLPAYGLWARHVEGLRISHCTFNYEKRDSRYAIFLDDVLKAHLSDIKVVRPSDNDHVIRCKNALDVTMENIVYFNDAWGNTPVDLPRIIHAAKGDVKFPKK